MSNVTIARRNLAVLAKQLQIGSITKPQAADIVRATIRLLAVEESGKTGVPQESEDS